MQSIAQRWCAELANPAQVCPGGGLPQAHAAGTMRQAESQQIRGRGNLAAAEKGFGLASQLFEVEIGWQTIEDVKPFGVEGRYDDGHLRQESYPHASGQTLSSPGKRYPNAYA